MTLLAGDIGGTKTLLRCFDRSGVTIVEARFDSAAYATFYDLLRDFLRSIPVPIESACFAVAGPVYGARAEITNVDWTIEEEVLIRTFAFGRVALMNDFYAVALGVPRLGREDVLTLREGTRDANAPIGILGAGTGLGEAIVIRVGGVHHVIPSEGGHGDFAPQDEEQARLFLHLHRQFGHVSWERVVSGMGLTSVYEFLGGEALAGEEIAALADGGDPRAEHAFEIFVDAYGAEAGNMALRVLARGGVFLAGGIAAKNTRRFTDGRFCEAFLRKGRFRDLVETIPLHLILNETVGLLGAAEGARRALESPLRPAG